MSFEVARIPQLSHQLAEPLDQADHDVAGRYLYVWIVFFPEKIASDLRHTDQSLQDHIGIVVRLYVVQADNARQIDGAVVCPGHFCIAVQHFYLLLRKRRIQHILWIIYFFLFNSRFKWLTFIGHKLLCRPVRSRSLDSCPASSRTWECSSLWTHDGSSERCACSSGTWSLCLGSICRTQDTHRHCCWTEWLNTVFQSQNQAHSFKCMLCLND